MQQPQFFFPAPVQVMRVTSQNIQDVAAWCGGSVQETKSKRKPGTMEPYVHVPTPNEAQISSAFPGMYITMRLVITTKGELKKTFAVFKRDYFEKNFFDTPQAATNATWEREAAERQKPKKVKNRDVHVTVNVGEELKRAQQKIEELQAQLDKKKAEDEILDRPRPTNYQERASAMGIDVFMHNHQYQTSCGDDECGDRYHDGLHVFSDVSVLGDRSGYIVLDGLPEPAIEKYFASFGKMFDTVPEPVERKQALSEPAGGMVAAVDRAYGNLG